MDTNLDKADFVVDVNDQYQVLRESLEFSVAVVVGAESEFQIKRRTGGARFFSDGFQGRNDGRMVA